MGTPITPARNSIYIEGAQFRSAISEDLVQRVGASINFINTYQYFPFYFGLAGNYSLAAFVGTLPATGLGPFETFDYNASIVNIRVYSGTTGSAGTTQVDIKKASAGSSVYTSIFSTLPAVTTTASNNVQFDINGVDGTLPTGCTRPVLSTVNFTSGDKLRLDVNSVMTGGADFIVTIFWRPR
jgi:hypothetical protein